MIITANLEANSCLMHLKTHNRTSEETREEETRWKRSISVCPSEWVKWVSGKTVIDTADCKVNTHKIAVFIFDWPRLCHVCQKQQLRSEDQNICWMRIEVRNRNKTPRLFTCDLLCPVCTALQILPPVHVLLSPKHLFCVSTRDSTWNLLLLLVAPPVRFQESWASDWYRDARVGSVCRAIDSHSVDQQFHASPSLFSHLSLRKKKYRNCWGKAPWFH